MFCMSRNRERQSARCVLPKDDGTEGQESSTERVGKKSKEQIDRRVRRDRATLEVVGTDPMGESERRGGRSRRRIQTRVDKAPEGNKSRRRVAGKRSRYRERHVSTKTDNGMRSSRRRRRLASSEEHRAEMKYLSAHMVQGSNITYETNRNIGVRSIEHRKWWRAKPSGACAGKQLVGGRFVYEDEAYLEYVVETSICDMVHTYVPLEQRGRGIARRLAEAAFRFAEEEGMSVRPTCSYISDTFLPRHPKYRPRAISVAIDTTTSDERNGT